MAPAEASRPTTIPTTAPGAVNPGHQMPSTSSGQNVEAATANAEVTSTPTSMLAAGSASSTTPLAAASGVNRSRRSVPGTRSCDSAPDTASSSPSEVARNAAKAPAVSSAVNRAPTGPWSTRAGSATTTVSVAPDRYSSGASTAPSSPYTPGNR
jgi:hypothetical protein